MRQLLRGPRRAVWRRVTRGLGIVALLAAIVGLGLRDLRAARARTAAFPKQEGAQALPGLAAPVSVLRDAHGVPHIAAQNERDAWFALGYVHAQDRLAQMLWLRQVARGRSAESVGKRGLPADRLARTLDFPGLARAELSRLSRHGRNVLESYAAGVSAHIADLRERVDHSPVEVERLALTLEAWEPADSLTLYKLHAWNRDNSIEASLVLSDLIEHLGPVGAGMFFPGPGLSAEGAPADAQAAAPARTASGWKLAAALRRAGGLAGRGIGSSAWVLGGGRTKSGHPIVAGDVHLEPTVPSALHLDHLRAGDLDIAGATLPGVPLFWCGHNRKVAWFPVGAPAVVVDLYVETLHPEDPTRYHDGSAWRPLERREEILSVRGAAAQTFEVRRTLNGPLLPDLDGRAPLAVRWVGALSKGGSGFDALLALSSAENAAELLDALREHREPMLAVAYADASGAAGVQVAGYVPRRSLSPQLLPLPGRARWYRWQDRVPFESLPVLRLEDSERWVVAADASLAARSGEAIDWLWRSGARAARIDALLREATRAGPVGLREVADLQSDVGGARSTRIIALATGLLGTRELGTQAGEVVRLLQDWEGLATAGSVGAAVYHVFLGQLLEALLVERMGAPLLASYLAIPQTDPEQLVLELLEAAQLAPEEGQRARVAKAVAESLRGSWLDLSYRLGANARRWTWGTLHPLRFRALGALGDDSGEYGLGPFAFGGSAVTVNAGPYDFSAPFAATTASTLRLVMDLGTPGQALVALAPGQSEHPGHAHRDDGVQRWLAGRSWLFATDPLLVEEASVARLDLEPLR